MRLQGVQIRVQTLPQHILMSHPAEYPTCLSAYQAGASAPTRTTPHTTKSHNHASLDLACHDLSWSSPYGSHSGVLKLCPCFERGRNLHHLAHARSRLLLPLLLMLMLKLMR